MATGIATKGLSKPLSNGYWYPVDPFDVCRTRASFFGCQDHRERAKEQAYSRDNWSYWVLEIVATGRDLWSGRYTRERRRLVGTGWNGLKVEDILRIDGNISRYRRYIASQYDIRASISQAIWYDSPLYRSNIKSLQYRDISLVYIIGHTVLDNGPRDEYIQYCKTLREYPKDVRQ